MKMSIYGNDWLIVDEANISHVKEQTKVHLVKLEFENPDAEKIEEVMDRFPSTNRYIISDNIKFYNDMLKARKKYYVENAPGVGLISFFKKNNKVMLNYNNLSPSEREFVDGNFRDVLRNIEVIYVSEIKVLFDKGLSQEIEYWNGNVLVRK